ncbi:MAG: hypothetical protein V4584_00315 [Verrucomicrobiota bacterium]
MTGQKIADYPDESGEFLRIAREVLEKKTLVHWYKEGVAIRRAQEYAAMPAAELPPLVAALAASMPPPSAERESEGQAKPAAAPSKVSYRCPKCRLRVWGKPNLSLLCGRCHEESGELVRLEVNAVYLQDRESWVSAGG